VCVVARTTAIPHQLTVHVSFYSLIPKLTLVMKHVILPVVHASAQVLGIALAVKQMQHYSLHPQVLVLVIQDILQTRMHLTVEVILTDNSHRS